MTDTKISALPASTTPLAGTEVLPIVQSSTTKQVSVANLTAGRAVSMLQIDAGNVRASGNTLTVTNTNGALSVLPNGSGTLFLNASSNIFGQNTILGGGTHIRVATNNNLEIFGPNTGTGVRLFARNDAGTLNRLELQGGAVIFITSGGADGATFNATSGDFTNAYGNYVQGTAGKGINFTANTPAAGMTSQLLNWYEEGTWTPNQGAGLTVVGAFSSSGTYTRVGRQITVRGQVTGATSVAVTAAGVISSNLPYTASVTHAGSMFNGGVNASGSVQITSTSVVAAAVISATPSITFTATYTV